MKALLFITLALTALSTQADIPRRPTPVLAKTISLEGASALELFEKLNAPERPNSALHTSYSTYKVFRSRDGLNQIVCIKAVSRIYDRTSATCKIQQSTSTKKLKVYRPKIRMG